MKDLEIEDKVLVCSYCMQPNPPKPCCGEIHVEEAYLLVDGTIISIKEYDELLDEL